ncbi:MAG: PLP-dependent transferase, partial [Blautia sp.]|nr:PLP-dependent transferase [Blautia sp.]
MAYAFSTRCIHLPKEKELKDRFGSISFPIYQTATFAHPGPGRSTGYDYTRSANPSRDYAERMVASMEQGEDALGFSSGMAAISLLMEVFKPGDHL